MADWSIEQDNFRFSWYCFSTKKPKNVFENQRRSALEASQQHQRFNCIPIPDSAFWHEEQQCETNAEQHAKAGSQDDEEVEEARRADLRVMAHCLVGFAAQQDLRLDTFAMGPASRALGQHASTCAHPPITSCPFHPPPPLPPRPGMVLWQHVPLYCNQLLHSVMPSCNPASCKWNIGAANFQTRQVGNMQEVELASRMYAAACAYTCVSQQLVHLATLSNTRI